MANYSRETISQQHHLLHDKVGTMFSNPRLHVSLVAGEVNVHRVQFALGVDASVRRGFEQHFHLGAHLFVKKHIY